MQRGDIWLVDLNPIRGSEQAGIRPVLVFQNDMMTAVSATIIAIPFTTNLRRAGLPSCVQVNAGDGGLASDSVALCHQLRVLDRTRFLRRLGHIGQDTLTAIEGCVLLTLGII